MQTQVSECAGPMHLTGRPQLTQPDKFGIVYRKVAIRIGDRPPHPYNMALVPRYQRLIDVAMEVLCMQLLRPTFFDEAKHHTSPKLKFVGWDESTQTASFRTA